MGIENPEKYSVGNVLAALNKTKLTKGRNLILTTGAGERISANVKDGRVIGWFVNDRDGKRIGTIPSQGVDIEGRITCWHCYKIRGAYHCFLVKCPFDIGD